MNNLLTRAGAKYLARERGVLLPAVKYLRVSTAEAEPAQPVPRFSLAWIARVDWGSIKAVFPHWRLTA